jgi:hypothetical protein
VEEQVSMDIMVEAGTNLDEIWRIDRGHVKYFFPAVSELITEYPADLPYFYTPESVYEYLDSGTWDLWVGFSLDREVELAALLSFDVYPMKTVYRFRWIGGKNWKRFMPGSIEKIERYAFAKHASEVVIEGRSGWVRRMEPHGYKPINVTITKSLIKKWGH